jgi:hypothetical protein
MSEGSLIGLLCSCNARSRKTLVGHAQWETESGHREAYFARWGRRGNERVWKEYVLMEAQQHPSGVKQLIPVLLC